MRIEQGKEEKIIFKQVECADDSIWAVDKDNQVFFKEYIMDDLNDHFHTTVFGDEDSFEMYNFPGISGVLAKKRIDRGFNVLVSLEKGTTSKVNSGGWAVYSEPNFQGKVTETLALWN